VGKRLAGVELYPENDTEEVNIDTHLGLTFLSTLSIGASGNITVCDVANGHFVDTNDLSVPWSSSPSGNSFTKANYTDESAYQTNIVGGVGFYFITQMFHYATISVMSSLYHYTTTLGRCRYLVEKTRNVPTFS
jgi:pectinesterase